MAKPTTKERDLVECSSSEADRSLSAVGAGPEAGKDVGALEEDSDSDIAVVVWPLESAEVGRFWPLACESDVEEASVSVIVSAVNSFDVSGDSLGIGAEEEVGCSSFVVVLGAGGGWSIR
jgi:hypothetical protein